MKEVTEEIHSDDHVYLGKKKIYATAMTLESGRESLLLKIFVLPEQLILF